MNAIDKRAARASLTSSQAHKGIPHLIDASGQIYDYCDETRTRSNILERVERRFGASDQHEPSLDQFLGQLLDWQLMVREGNQFLSVAVPPVPFQPANPA